MGITGSSMNGMMETAFSTLMGGGTFTAEDLQTMMDMLSFGDITGSAIAEKLRKAQLDVMTPIEALNLLYQLKQKLS